MRVPGGVGGGNGRDSEQRETARGREEVRFTRRTLDPFRKERYLETRIQVRDALIAPRVSHSLSLFLGPGGPVYMFVQVCVCVFIYTHTEIHVSFCLYLSKTEFCSNHRIILVFFPFHFCLFLLSEKTCSHCPRDSSSLTQSAVVQTASHPTRPPAPHSPSARSGPRPLPPSSFSPSLETAASPGPASAHCLQQVLGTRDLRGDLTQVFNYSEKGGGKKKEGSLFEFFF